MYDTLMKNICNGGLGIRCMSNDCITVLITSLYRNELVLKRPHKSIVEINSFIQANGIDATLFDLINKLKDEEQLEDDEYRRDNHIDLSMLAKAPERKYR